MAPASAHPTTSTIVRDHRMTRTLLMPAFTTTQTTVYTGRLTISQLTARRAPSSVQIRA